MVEILEIHINWFHVYLKKLQTKIDQPVYNMIKRYIFQNFVKDWNNFGTIFLSRAIWQSQRSRNEIILDVNSDEGSYWLQNWVNEIEPHNFELLLTQRSFANFY